MNKKNRPKQINFPVNDLELLKEFKETCQRNGFKIGVIGQRLLAAFVKMDPAARAQLYTGLPISAS